MEDFSSPAKGRVLSDDVGAVDKLLAGASAESLAEALLSSG